MQDNNDTLDGELNAFYGDDSLETGRECKLSADEVIDTMNIIAKPYEAYCDQLNGSDYKHEIMELSSVNYGPLMNVKYEG